MNNRYILSVVVWGVTLFFSSCGPVNRFTRVKKIPREHSLNYCIGEVKAPKTELNKEPWIVFSDREKNQTTRKPGKKGRLKNVDYLEPFLVIKQKGEHLRLIKYTPDILKNGKLEYKKAKYYGWINKSRLLLDQQSVTDIASGKKNKTLVVLSDTLFINQPDKYFSADSVKTYKDLDMNSEAGTVPLYSIVYQLKQSGNGQTLIAKKPYLKAEEINEDVLGWIDNTLIKDVGTGLHTNIETISPEKLQFVKPNGTEVSITGDIAEMTELLVLQYPTIKYNPVSSYCIQDSMVAFRTRKVIPVFDQGDNYVFNVNGGHISNQHFRAINRDLRKINVSFVFEGNEQTITLFPQIVNALQSLQPLFERETFFSYQFNCVATFDDEQGITPFVTQFTSEYSALINTLSAKANKSGKLKPLKLSNTSWPGLRKALEMLDNQKNATNLIILIGEKGYGGEDVDPTLTNRLLRNNCRIAAFQVYAGNEDIYNNFVLNVGSMINAYADGMLRTKKDVLVSPEQIRRANFYREVDTDKNSFRLDFPDNSITQGFLFFPQKKGTLPMEFLPNDIDSILIQIKNDNTEVITYAARAFHSFGNNRTKFDSLYSRSNNLDITQIPSKKLISSFNQETPGWYLPSKIVLLDKSANEEVDYRLMLSELEKKELMEFIQSLSAKELELKSQATKNKKLAKKKICNCPEDDLFFQLSLETKANDNDSIPPEYASTRKVRKYLYKQYMSTMKYCKYCKDKKRVLKRLPIAEAHRRIIGSPTNEPVLNAFRVKDLKKQKQVPDKMLGDLIRYFKDMVEEPNKAEQFTSNDETYYWLDRKLLP